MKRFLDAVVEFLKSEDGPTSVEYAINIALVVTVCVSAMSSIGNKASKTFTTVSNAIANTTGS
jgi:pilus assembly protein Flp/PilA